MRLLFLLIIFLSHAGCDEKGNSVILELPSNGSFQLLENSDVYLQDRIIGKVDKLYIENKTLFAQLRLNNNFRIQDNIRFILYENLLSESRIIIVEDDSYSRNKRKSVENSVFKVEYVTENGRIDSTLIEHLSKWIESFDSDTLPER